MFFYPDQYYRSQQSPYRQEEVPHPPHPPATHPAHPSHPAAGGLPQHGFPGMHPGAQSFFFPGDFPFATTPGYGAPVPPPPPPASQARPEHRPSAPSAAGIPPFVSNRSQASQSDREVYALDEDELEALRAFRESKRLRQERDRRQLEALAKRKAEAERRAKETAQREHDLRIRAQVEANARAAAREYLRRQQERQNALQQAQQAERQDRQQMLLEQLRRQFGLFTIPSSSNQSDGVPYTLNTEGEGADAQESPEQPDEGATAANTATSAEPKLEGDEELQSQEQKQKPQSEDNFIDPIRALIEALAPYPFVISTESSDDDESQSKLGRASSNAKDNAPPTEYSVSVEPRVELDVDGPTCETVTEDGNDDEEEDPVIDISEVPSTARKHHRKHHRKHPHRKGGRATSSATATATASSTDQAQQPHDADEMCGLLKALETDFQRVNDSYQLLLNAPPTDSLQEIITRIEGVKICYARSEEIYTKLDEMRVSKIHRKEKQLLTSESVAMADKCDDLLREFENTKQEIREKNKPAASDFDTSPNSPSSDSKRHVTLEEVDDESE